MHKRSTGWFVCLVVYALAFALGAEVVDRQSSQFEPLTVLLLADLGATIVVFAASTVFKNASLYDPYWSVAPIAFLVFWASHPDTPEFNARAIIVSVLLTVWGVRLTYNWLRGWGGLQHEDWRYVQLRKQSGIFFPLVNLFGIQMFPTLLVFAGGIPLQYIFQNVAPLGVFDILGTVVLLTGILLETIADRQMHDFLRSAQPGELCRRGLWSRSRHPNYFGEWCIWLGLGLFAVAAQGPWLGAAAGVVLMLLLFRLISIPMIEKRHRTRRPGYEAYVNGTPVFVPRLW